MIRAGYTFRPAWGRSGFTIVELLVVISVIVIASTLIVPAFQDIVRSSNLTLATNRVTSALSNARSAAVNDGRHTGVVFLFDAERERYTLRLVQESGRSGYLSTFAMNDPITNETTTVPAQPFHPLAGSAPTELPRGTGVYGLSFLLSGENDMIDGEVSSWYAGDILDGGDSDEYPWIFPRNDGRLFMPDDDGDGVGDDPWEVLFQGSGDTQAMASVLHANTFFVRFAPNGSVTSTTRLQGGSIADAWLEYPGRPIDSSQVNPTPYDDPILFDPERGHDDADEPEPNPEVILRHASALAVVDFRALGAAPGVRDERPWLFRTESSRAPGPLGSIPSWIDNRYTDDDAVRAVSEWIDENAEIIQFNRSTGEAMRRPPQ